MDCTQSIYEQGAEFLEKKGITQEGKYTFALSEDVNELTLEIEKYDDKLSITKITDYSESGESSRHCEIDFENNTYEERIQRRYSSGLVYSFYSEYTATGDLQLLEVDAQKAHFVGNTTTYVRDIAFGKATVEDNDISIETELLTFSKDYLICPENEDNAFKAVSLNLDLDEKDSSKGSLVSVVIRDNITNQTINDRTYYQKKDMPFRGWIIFNKYRDAELVDENH